MQRASALLARREHSRHELRHKLARNGADMDEIEAALEKLAAGGLQSDARFAEHFVRARIRKGQGPLKIGHALQERGVGPDLITKYLGAGQIDWLRQARRVRAGKFGEPPPLDYRNKARQSRFLHSRGFERDVIQQALNQSGFSARHGEIGITYES